jgi:hypothetical protein
MNWRNFIPATILLAHIATLFGQQNPGDAQAALAEKQRAQVQEAMTLSIGRQMASVQKRLGAAPDPKGFFVTAPTLVAATVPDCDPMSPMTIQGIAKRAAERSRIAADLVMAVIQQESGFRPCAVSDKGAMGLMQLMPDTAADFGVIDAFDPEQNISAGTRLLKSLFDRYAGDLNRVLGAYNAGAARVDQYGGIPPFPETENYVDSITRAFQLPQALQ